MIPAVVVFVYLGIVLYVLSMGGTDIVARGATGMLVCGLLPVVPMTIVSALLLVAVSALTPRSRPAAATMAKYFVDRTGIEAIKTAHP